MSRVDSLRVPPNTASANRAYSGGMDINSNPLEYLTANPGVLGLVLVLMVAVMTLKGFALWRAARNNSSAWFIALLVVNTLGVLELLYLFVFGKKKS